MIQTEAVEAAIMDQFGLVKRDGWEDALTRAAIDLGGQANLSPDVLLAQAVSDTTLLKKLVGRLTIPESYFFRHEEQMMFLAAHISEILMKDPHHGQVSIWSAGCSGGEESYTLAILLKESLAPSMLRNIQLVGNDINGEIVKSAERGIYSDWHFRGLSDIRRNAYFRPLGNGQYQLNDNIREMVRFFHCSIQERLSTMAAESVDVLLFRNVGIYLSNVCLESLYNGFFQVLKPGGILCVAPSDPPPAHAVFNKLTFDHGLYYQKAGALSASSDIHLTPFNWLDHDAWPHSIPEHEPPAPDHPDVETLPIPVAQSDAGSESSIPSVWRSILAGRAALDANDPQKAESIFRQAVFSDPVDPMARFWYAFSLLETKAFNRSKAQLNALIATLEAVSPSTVLVDGTSTARELLESARVLLETMDLSHGE